MIIRRRLNVRMAAWPRCLGNAYAGSVPWLPLDRRSSVLILLLATLAMMLLGCGKSASYKEGEDETGELGRVQEESPADIYVKLGIAYMREGQYAIALRKLKQGLEADQDSAQAHNVIALLYERLGEAQLAQQHYSQAVELERVLADRQIFVMCRAGDRAVDAGELATTFRIPGPDFRGSVGIAHR